ncbi:hypothetical protein BSZ36_15365 [Rubricoccus marinus]|uniref:LTD domain-containing protein n=1 Tax=Rubricoccus marinus TaxID=716817 RepID=A0A259U331_9BACT|nr:hypothetical protein BSZ36_15365 [Rubricoccus marinus]
MLLVSGCETRPRVSTAGPGAPPPEAVLYTDVVAGDLLGVLDRDFSPVRTLGYSRARDELYGWEQSTQGVVCGIYTEYCVTLGAGDASQAADARGINAEHVWPQSKGAREEPLRSDLHHLFPSRQTVNSSRGNLPFGEVPDSQTDAWYLADASQSQIPDPPLAPWSERGDGKFEPREDRKGDIARAVFYVVAVYPEQVDRGFFESMEQDLLVWNRQDPPDDREQVRNVWVASLQGTQNPFIIDPTLADRIWNGGVRTGAPVPTPQNPTPEVPRPAASGGVLWINEIHYDNEGDDSGEGVEIAGPDGTSLEGWTLLAVNGSNGTAYHTMPLAGRLVGDGIGTEWIAIPGLQNGSPDGIALVSPRGETVEALTWEGSFTDARGLLFQDIGVSESPRAPLGTSLQRIGQGRSARDFQWASGAASPGWLNERQRASERR